MKLIDRSCCFSFDDLFLAAHHRPMTDAERQALRDRDQPARNRLVRQWVAETAGDFACEDRRGTDGVLYTAFWQIETTA